MEIAAAVWVLAVACHNLEEAIWLPDWSNRAGRWHSPVTSRQFGFAVTVLTVLAAVAAFMGAQPLAAPVWRYALAGYALAMALNFVVPHAAGSLALKAYLPGTLTSGLLVMPSSLWLIKSMADAGQIALSTLVWAGPLVVLAIVGSIPVLFQLGKRL